MAAPRMVAHAGPLAVCCEPLPFSFTKRVMHVGIPRPPDKHWEMLTLGLPTYLLSSHLCCDSLIWVAGEPPNLDLIVIMPNKEGGGSMETMPCSADGINRNRSPGPERRLEVQEKGLQPVVGTNSGGGQQGQTRVQAMLSPQPSCFSCRRSWELWIGEGEGA